MYLAVTFAIYAFALLATLPPRELAVVFIVFPFGAYAPYTALDPYAALAFWAVSSSAMLFAASRAVDNYPLTAFMLASRVFTDSLPVVAFSVTVQAELTILPYNPASYALLGTGQTLLVVGLSMLFILVAEYYLVILFLYRGQGLPLLIRAMMYPLLGTALLAVMVLHEMGHVFFGTLVGLRWVGFGMAFPVGAYVLLEGTTTPEGMVLVAAGGNIAVTLFLIASRPLVARLYRARKYRLAVFLRAMRVIGAQLTLFNALPAFGIVAPTLDVFLLASVDGSRVLLYGLLSPIALLLAVAITYFCVKESLVALREESLMRVSGGL